MLNAVVRAARPVVQRAPKAGPIVTQARSFSKLGGKHGSGLHVGPIAPQHEHLFSPEFCQWFRPLAEEKTSQYKMLLAARHAFQKDLSQGKQLSFREDTAHIRDDLTWQGASIPQWLQTRHVEITGPTNDPKMVINALNSGADVYMTDCEDSQSPTWGNVVGGHHNIYEAVRGTLSHTKVDENGEPVKTYTLDEKTAILFVRARGIHLFEANVGTEEGDVPAGLLDIGLHMFHNARPLIDQGRAPCFYFPKLQTMEEGALLNSVLTETQESLGIPVGTARATTLIETLPGLYQNEEILHALRDHSAGQNCGRWDHIFSTIKSSIGNPNFRMPDCDKVGMGAHFLTEYARRIVQVNHRRGNHAMGGMSAFIPSKDPEETKAIMAKVVADKQWEVEMGCDGGWVAHPGMVSQVKQTISDGLDGHPHQVASDKQKEATFVDADFVTIQPELTVPENFSEAGLRKNIRVGVQYIAAWLAGNGAVALDGLMEDLATAEIRRTQIWDWLQRDQLIQFEHGTHGVLTKEYVALAIADEMAALKDGGSQVLYAADKLDLAAKLFEQSVFSKKPIQFIPDIAYQHLNK